MKLLLLISLGLYVNSCSSQDAMYFNASRIGRSVSDSEPVLVFSSTNAIAPTKLTMEINNGLVVAALVEYPKAVTKEMLRRSINHDFAYCEKKLSTSTIYIWRDEKRKITFLVGDGQPTDGSGVILIVRSVDKNVQKMPSWP